MNRDELLAILRDTYYDDPEEAHLEHDKALLEYIGDPEIVAAFKSQTKWYS